MSHFDDFKFSNPYFIYLTGTHGNSHVDQRSLQARSSYVSRSTSTFDTLYYTQGTIRISTSTPRSVLPVPTGTLPQRNATEGENILVTFTIPCICRELRDSLHRDEMDTQSLGTRSIQDLLALISYDPSYH
jgi:hypothetical protein